jgi:tetratricopeptide (TPR) repeat protein
MQDNQGIVPQRNQFPKLPSHVMGSNQATSSLAENIQRSNMGQLLKEACLAYVQTPSPENFAKLKAKCDSLIKTRRMLLTVGRYAESQTTLSMLSMICALIAERGTLEQCAQMDFVSLVQQALAELGEFAEKLTLEDVALISITWDEWLFSALPACLQANSYQRDRPESLCGLLSCLLIYQALGQYSECSKIFLALRDAGLDVLQSKGKRIYLKAWLEDVFSNKVGFDWRNHREVQGGKWGYVFSLAEVYRFFENDQLLLRELRDIAKLDDCLEKLKAADYLKRPEEKEIAAILVQMEALAGTLAERAKPQENRYWREHSMNALMFYSGILFSLTNPRWKIEPRNQEAVRQRVIEKIKAVELSLLVGMNAQRQEKHRWKEDSRYLKQLEGYRRKARAELLNIIAKEATADTERLARAEQLERFSQSIVAFMKEFMSGLIAASIADCGPAPCQYAFIGFGSFEKQSMTPYSDLEFGILIQEDSAGNREYFRNLTYILQAKIIQLGETPIPLSLFDYNFDHLTNAGFCLDLGGKISLGRSYGEGERQDPGKFFGTLKYELIGTPEQLLGYIEDDFFSVDKLLPVELSHCAFIAGESELNNHYQRLLVKRMGEQDQQEQLFCQRRAMTYLQGNAALEGDLEKYTPKLDKTRDGQLFDVKKEIYRLPDRLISDLALFFGILVGGAWQKITQLVERKVITPGNAKHLRIMEGIAKEIRFNTYFYYGRQREHLSVMPLLFKEDNTLFRLENPLSIERFYQSALPFQQQLKLFCEAWKKTPHEAVKILQVSPFNDVTLWVQVKIASRLGQHKKVQALLGSMQKHRPRTQTRVSKVRILTQLAHSYLDSGNFAKALDYFKQVLKIQERHLAEDQIGIASTLMGLGSVYGALGYYEKQVSLQERALVIDERALGAEHVKVAVSLVNLGTGYGALGDHQKRVRLQERALVILERAFGGEDVDVAATLANLGNGYGALGDYQKQMRLQERALAIEERAFGAEHVTVAITLVSLGSGYGHLGDYQKQVRLQERARAICERAFGEEHLKVAGILVNLGNGYGALGDYQKQVSVQERGLVIFEQAFGAGNVDVAALLVNLGIAYGHWGDYQKQVSLQERALVIEERVLGAEHVKVAGTLVNLGNGYGELGDYQKQVSLQERALVIGERAFGAEHVHVAGTLVNLGNGYGELGDYQKQVSLQERALMIEERALGAEHVKVAGTLVNLGNGYGVLGDYQKQVRLQERALVIFERAFGAEHVKVADTLANLANGYRPLGDYQKSVCLQERALVIFERAFGVEHVKVAVTLVNLGSAYGDLGDYQKSVCLQERALVIFERAFGAQHVRVATTLGNLGSAYGNLGDYQKQVHLQERALEINRRTFGADHPDNTIIAARLDAGRLAASKEPAHSPAALLRDGGLFNFKEMSEAPAAIINLSRFTNDQQNDTSAERNKQFP